MGPLEDAYRAILSEIPHKSSDIEDTPRRCAKAIRELTQGYQESVFDLCGQALFPYQGQSNQVVRVDDLQIFSLCEHHLLPFFGRCTIAYVPHKHILGLSKFQRLVEVYSRRLQVQERLTQEIVHALETVLETPDVAVILKCTHMCMSMRGVRNPQASTLTHVLEGVFKEDPLFRDPLMRAQIFE